MARRGDDDLVSQGYAVGDRLPSEAEMLGTLGVSRESLREGLRLLEVQGLIAIRRGQKGGPRVTPVNAAYLARSVTLYLHVAGATYREVFESRLEIEPTLVAKVARRPDREFLGERMSAFLDLDGYHDPRAVFDVSATFHGEIGRLSGNRVMVLLLQSINHILTELMMEQIDLEREGPGIEHDHRQLAAAIMHGHARKAERLGQEHIENLREQYAAVSEGRIDAVVDWR